MNTIGFRNLAVGTARHAVVHAWRLDQEKGVDIQTLGSNYHVVAMVGAPVVAVPNPVGSNCRKNLLVALPREVLAQLIAAGVAALVAALVALPRAAVVELGLNAAGGPHQFSRLRHLQSPMAAFEAEAHQLRLDIQLR